MLRRLFAVLAMLSAFVVTPIAWAQSAPSCSFVLGFQTLHDLIPTIVGGCVDDEQHNPANGDAFQQTTEGLMARHKADTFTAFTNGYQSWINGARLQQRWPCLKHKLLYGQPPGFASSNNQPTATI